MTTGGYELLVPPRPRQQLVHIHAGAEELGRVYDGDLLLNASMACAAPALAALAPPASLRWREWTAGGARRLARPTACRRRSRRSTWPRWSMRSTATPGATPSSPTAPATSPAGCIRFHRYRRLRHAGRTQLAPTSGAMGYGVPAAVAAALLEPQRTVINLAGDGDFLMNGQELATATAHGAAAAPAS